LGAAAATPEILARLANLLEHSHRKVRWTAVWAVGGLGAAATTPEILARLANLLQDPHRDVWWRWDVRREAAQTFDELMSQGVRIFEGPSGKWEWRSVTELANLTATDEQKAAD
ncbi:MAG: HEAT repeat domain-containing protein, partial [Dehalococcoidia bacterium]